VQNFLKIGSGVPELVDPEKWHSPLKAFIALTTVLRYRADCDYAIYSRNYKKAVANAKVSARQQCMQEGPCSEEIYSKSSPGI